MTKQNTSFWRTFREGFMETWDDPWCWLIYGGAGAITGVLIAWGLHV